MGSEACIANNMASHYHVITFHMINHRAGGYARDNASTLGY